MRGHDNGQTAIFSYVSVEARVEARVPHGHPLRAIKAMTDKALREPSSLFAWLYSPIGRPSIAPERLLRALLLQAPYPVRSERLVATSAALRRISLIVFDRRERR